MIARFLTGLLRIGAACAIGCASLQATADDAAGLRTRYTDLREQLDHNIFHRAIYIDSTQAGENLKGDVYAVLDHPFGKVSGALKSPENWCDILILPFNTKYCRAASGEGGANLQVRIGRKFDQPVQDAYLLQFAFRGVAASPEYFESRLAAKEGPLGTRDYNIAISAVPLDAKRTFMHLSYAYGYGITGKMAMKVYLATVGADKVGFSVTGTDANTQPIYPKVPLDARCNLTTQVTGYDIANTGNVSPVTILDASESGAIIFSIHALSLIIPTPISGGGGSPPPPPVYPDGIVGLGTALNPVGLLFFSQKFGDEKWWFVEEITLNPTARQSVYVPDRPILPAPQKAWHLAPFERIGCSLSRAIAAPGLNVFLTGGQYS